MLGERVATLLAAGGSAWEVPALQALAGDPRVVVVKRCVDLPDLVASATTGQALVAVVDAAIPGLDSDTVDRLRREGVSTVVVAEEGSSAAHLGVSGIVHLPGDRAADPDLGALAEAVVRASADTGQKAPVRGPAAADDVAAEAEEDTTATSGAAGRGRTLAVWGPGGAPGRTTVAVALAAALAARGEEAFLLDVDPFGGAVAQHLGILDEVSGLLSAARLANAGQLDATRLAAAARQVSPRLRVLTGLPRADRWVEVREAAFGRLLDLAPTLASRVVLDLGFCLEHDGPGYGTGPGRHHMTLAALDRADEILVVGSADPVGLARLARGLVELLELVPAASLRVVVNRMRPALGWDAQQVRAMIEGFVTPAGIHVLPHDLAGADRALVAGQPLPDVGDTALGAAVAALADALTGSTSTRRRRPLRRRTAGRAR